MLGIEKPLLLAPMFLISNTKMVKAALDAGATAAIPAANYRSVSAMKADIRDIQAYSKAPFGINLVVNRSNPKYKEQLDAILETAPAFVVASLGNPRDCIEKCHEKGIQVFCDVVNIKFAKKAEALGADALIAVNSQAGGHAGNIPYQQLIPELKNACDIPVISAGGVGTSGVFKKVMDAGADGVSVGSVFIASEEADISEDYREALIQYGASDIVRSTKISGTPLMVINTPFVQKIGARAGLLDWILNHHKGLKKFAKRKLMNRGSKWLEKSALKAGYHNVWCAGPAIEYIHSIRPVRQIIEDLVKELSTIDS